MVTQARRRPEPPSLLEILAPLSGHLTEVERRLLLQTTAFDPGVRSYVEYALDGQGKRLRPSLALLSTSACGTALDEGPINLGVIVELIHVATLVHDDINDGALVRRSKPTANAKWGNEISVLLGDCLFARALQIAASFPTTEVCRRVAEATNVVCSGEILQTQNRYNFNLTIDEYLKFIEMKTAELFAVSCELGGYLGGADSDVKHSLREYGLNLGIAYQIYDDCLDIFGQEPKAGKSLGTDLAKGKLTLPILRVIADAPAAEREKVNALILRNGQGNARDWMKLFGKHLAIEYTLDVTQKYIQAASAALARVPASESRDRLSQLADFVSDQVSSIALYSGGR
jgi:octaprenyl-diphosphate synthase